MPPKTKQKEANWIDDLKNGPDGFPLSAEDSNKRYGHAALSPEGVDLMK